MTVKTVKTGLIFLMPLLKGCMEQKRERFGSTYNITTHVTSPPFHAQAFAHCAAIVAGNVGGTAGRLAFEEACFAKQESFMNAALGDCKKSDVKHTFVSIARSSALVKEEFTEEASFLSWMIGLQP
jgi:hypothetical protein